MKVYMVPRKHDTLHDTLHNTIIQPVMSSGKHIPILISLQLELYDKFPLLVQLYKCLCVCVSLYARVPLYVCLCMPLCLCVFVCLCTFVNSFKSSGIRRIYTHIHLSIQNTDMHSFYVKQTLREFQPKETSKSVMACWKFNKVPNSR